MSRPFLNDDKRRAVCAILARGGTLVEAAECLRCSVGTLKKEQRRNPRFREQVLEARARALLMPYQVVRKAACPNWRAASWMIERAEAQQRRRDASREFAHDALVRAVRERLPPHVALRLARQPLAEPVAPRDRSPFDMATTYATAE